MGHVIELGHGGSGGQKPGWGVTMGRERCVKMSSSVLQPPLRSLAFDLVLSDLCDLTSCLSLRHCPLQVLLTSEAVCLEFITGATGV